MQCDVPLKDVLEGCPPSFFELLIAPHMSIGSEETAIPRLVISTAVDNDHHHRGTTTKKNPISVGIIKKTLRK